MTTAVDTFTCDNCGGTWPKGWSDEEADAEYTQAFGLLPPTTDRAVVCDDCYAEIMAWVEEET